MVRATIVSMTCPPAARERRVSNRKPPKVSRESWIERQIREAQERGEFDNLPGAGKPLPDLDRPRDDLWWVRNKLKEENLSYVPPALQLRKDVEEARERIARARSEQEARQIVVEINEVIRVANRSLLDGPPSSVAPLDEELAVRRWRDTAGGDA